MPFTEDPTVVTQAVVDAIDADKATYATPVVSVRYGLQELEPTFPAVFCQSGPMTREIVTLRQFSNIFTVFVTVLLGDLDKSPEVNQKDAEALVKAIGDTLDVDRTLGGLVFFGIVTRVEQGATIHRSRRLKSWRLTWQGDAREAF